MNHVITDPVVIVEDSSIGRVGNSKFDKVKVGTKTAKFKSHDKSKHINSSKALAQNFRSGFLIYKDR